MILDRSDYLVCKILPPAPPTTPSPSTSTPTSLPTHSLACTNYSFAVSRAGWYTAWLSGGVFKMQIEIKYHNGITCNHAIGEGDAQWNTPIMAETSTNSRDFNDKNANPYTYVLPEVNRTKDSTINCGKHWGNSFASFTLEVPSHLCRIDSTTTALTTGKQYIYYRASNIGQVMDDTCSKIGAGWGQVQVESAEEATFLAEAYNSLGYTEGQYFVKMQQTLRDQGYCCDAGSFCCDTACGGACSRDNVNEVWCSGPAPTAAPTFSPTRPPTSSTPSNVPTVAPLTPTATPVTSPPTSNGETLVPTSSPATSTPSSSPSEYPYDEDVGIAPDAPTGYIAIDQSNCNDGEEEWIFGSDRTMAACAAQCDNNADCVGFTYTLVTPIELEW